jgi:thioredoxin 1
MKNKSRIGIVAALVVMIGVVLAVKQAHRQPGANGQNACCPSQSACCPQIVNPADLTHINVTSAPAPALPAETSVAAPSETKPLPRLLDLGAGKCIPCKMMAPILEELKKEYAGRMEVVFVDVWQNPDAGKAYNVEMIPTQIFYDAEGRELFRHVGFFAKEDILAKWKELGVDLN